MNYVRELASRLTSARCARCTARPGSAWAADLQALNQATRISAEPSAVSYLANNITFTGRLAIPVLTMHTTGDGLVVPENEQAYRSAVDRAGHGAPCSGRSSCTGPGTARSPRPRRSPRCRSWSAVSTPAGGTCALAPASLNAQAAALGPQYNIFESGSAVVPTPPAFLHYRPAPYLRPFDLAPGGRVPARPGPVCA